MSILGTVYVIDIAEGIKDIYPVVYKNKELMYCKIHCSSQLKPFYTPETTLFTYDTNIHDFFQSPPEIYTITLEDYKLLTGHILNYRGSVYVPPHTHYFFPEFKSGHWEAKINAARRKINLIKEEIERRKNYEEREIKRLNASIEDYYKKIEEYQEMYRKEELKEQEEE